MLPDIFIRVRSRRIFTWGPLCLVVLFVSCVPRLKQYYADEYFPQDHIYENRALGFTLRFAGNWDVTTDPRDMKGAGRETARMLQRSGVELIFVGHTVEGTQGTRGVVAHANLPSMEYARHIRQINSESIDEELDMEPCTAAGKSMVRWQYRIGSFLFVEFFFRIETYNVRVAFWAKRDIFERFIPVYEDIIGSLQVTDTY